MAKTAPRREWTQYRPRRRSRAGWSALFHRPRHRARGARPLHRRRPLPSLQLRVLPRQRHGPRRSRWLSPRSSRLRRRNRSLLSNRSLSPRRLCFRLRCRSRPWRPFLNRRSHPHPNRLNLPPWRRHRYREKRALPGPRENNGDRWILQPLESAVCWIVLLEVVNKHNQRLGRLMNSWWRALGGVVLLCAAAHQTASAQTEEYVLKAGDVIRITVAEHPEFSGQHKIRPDGRINYPVVGEIDVASLTCEELVKLLQGKLVAYINNPVVSVGIEAYYANTIFAIGGVRKPGVYQIYEPIDVMKALAMVGGLSRKMKRRIKIIRADGTVVTIPMREFWGNDVRRDNTRWILYPGDTLYVPDGFAMPWGLISTILGIINITLIIILNSDRVGGL